MFKSDLPFKLNSAITYSSTEPKLKWYTTTVVGRTVASTVPCMRITISIRWWPMFAALGGEAAPDRYAIYMYINYESWLAEDKLQ